MPYNNHPLFNSLTAALDYCRDTPVLHASVDMLSDLVAHHSYTGHPDDECVYENSMRGDLECYYYTCMDIQETYEDVTVKLLELPEGHPAYPSIAAAFNDLVDRYGADSKK